MKYSVKHYYKCTKFLAYNAFFCLILMITVISQQIMIKVLSTQKSILWEPSDAGEQMSTQTDRPTDMAMLTVTVLSFVNKLGNSNVYE